MDRITVRFSEKELTLLKREAKKSGISVSQYVRNKVLGNFEDSIFEQYKYYPPVGKCWKADGYTSFRPYNYWSGPI